MPTRILTIEARDKFIGSVCRLSDFTFTEGDPISPEVVAQNPNIFQYCLDDASQRAIFVELPPGIDLTEVPFYHQVLFENARHLIAVPYETFHELAAAASRKPQNVIIVHNTGRSGSTLLHQVFNQLNSVVSLSEPDAFLNGLYGRAADGSHDQELIALLRSSLVMTFRPFMKDGITTCAIKLRNQAVGIMDLLYAAFPEARHLFNYRNAVDFTASFYRLFMKYGAMQTNTPEEMVQILCNQYAREPEEVKSYFASPTPHLAIVDFLAVMWLLLMDRALKLGEQGIPFLSVRYEDLDAHREDVVRALFDYCGLPPEQVEIGLRAFAHDAQEGTMLAREKPQEGNTLSLTPAQVAEIQAVLDRHPIIHTPDFVLPGTLQI